MLTKSEIPNKVRVDERSDEATRRCIDMDLDVQAVFLFELGEQFVEGGNVL